MDDLEFTISASGEFGNFMWEYPDKVKELFQKVQEVVGEDIVRGIMETQKDNILSIIHIQLGVLYAGSLAPVLATNLRGRIRELAEEQLKLLRGQ